MGHLPIPVSYIYISSISVDQFFKLKGPEVFSATQLCEEHRLFAVAQMVCLPCDSSVYHLVIQHSHGKSPFLIDLIGINGPLSHGYVK